MRTLVATWAQSSTMWQMLLRFALLLAAFACGGSWGPMDEALVPLAIAEAPPVPLEPETEDEREGLKKILKRFKFCEVCSGGSINKEGWAHKSRLGHPMRALDAHERGQVAQEWLFQRRGGDAARDRHFRENRERQLAQEANLQPALPEASPVKPWTFNFGRHKGKTLRDVLRLEPDYISWAVASQLQNRYPAFELELKKEGLWEKMLQESEKKRQDLRKRAHDKLAETEASLEAGESMSKDIVKMRRLAVEVADARAAAPPVAIAGDDQLAPGCSTPPHKQKREHRSRALVSLHHCGVCGKIGHKTPTCPAALDQALSTEAVAATRDIVVLGKEKRLAKVVAHLKYVWPEQRTAEYEARPTKASRGVTELSLVAMARMSVHSLCGMALEAGLWDQGYAMRGMRVLGASGLWDIGTGIQVQQNVATHVVYRL